MNTASLSFDDVEGWSLAVIQDQSHESWGGFLAAVAATHGDDGHGEIHALTDLLEVDSEPILARYAAMRETQRESAPFKSPRPKDKPEEQPKKARTERVKSPMCSYRLTDSGNMERFVSEYADRVRFDVRSGQWLLWNGLRWQPDEKGEIMPMAQDVARSIYGEAESGSSKEHREKISRWAAQSESHFRLKAMLALTRTASGIPLLPNQLDSDPFLLGVENGVIGLRTGEPIAPDPKQLITRCARVRYDPTAEAPTWIQHLNRTFAGDQEMIFYLQRFLGYCLTGDVKERAFAIAYGPPGSGKSTTLNPFLELMGDYGKVAPVETFTLKKFESGGPRNDLAGLFGSRFVIASETNRTQALDEALLKRLAGGIGEQISCRFLRREYFSFSPGFKCVFMTNYKPRVHGDDQAIFDRLRLLPFPNRIEPEDRDPDLPLKLRAEFPGILLWLISGALAWQREGLGTCPAVDQATTNYQLESDPILRFVNETCTRDKFAISKSTTLYSIYTTWVQDAGEKPFGQRAFSQRIEALGFKKKHTETGNHFIGIKLQMKAEG